MDRFEHRLVHTLRGKSLQIGSSSVEAGFVTRRVRRRRVLMATGSAMSLALLVLAGARALPAIRNHNGGDFAASTIPSPSYPGAPGEINEGSEAQLDCSGFASKCVVFASGSRNGKEWALFLYESSRQDGQDEMWCQGEFFDGDFGGGCPAALPSGQANGHYVAGGRYSVSSVEEDIVDGRLDPKVGRVEIRLVGYEPFDVPIISGPDVAGNQDPGVNYFIAFVPTDARGDIVVYDTAGNEMDSREIPDLEPMLLRSIYSKTPVHERLSSTLVRASAADSFCGQLSQERLVPLPDC